MVSDSRFLYQMLEKLRLDVNVGVGEIDAGSVCRRASKHRHYNEFSVPGTLPELIFGGKQTQGAGP
jgi:hypothetical protein